jgi:DNA-binding CsgD family transcriptional regulator
MLSTKPTSASATSSETATTAPAEARSFLPANLPPVTNRQLEVLYWVRAGKSAPDIGVIMGISGRTVESHIGRLCEHLGVRTRLQAVLKAQALGLIEDSTP